MPTPSLKYSAPSGPVSIESTRLPWLNGVASRATPVRSAFSVTSWMSPVLNEPKNRSPSRAVPSPQPLQNAMPVGPIVVS